METEGEKVSGNKTTASSANSESGCRPRNQHMLTRAKHCTKCPFWYKTRSEILGISFFHFSGLFLLLLLLKVILNLRLILLHNGALFEATFLIL